MIDTFLSDIPFKQLYDGKASIYELAGTAFSGRVMLREHFRCVPEIISFSNGLSYKGEIQPLRDPSSAAVKPAVISYRVETGSERRERNDGEGLHIAALLVACTEQPEYAEATFGVISLLGHEQAPYIERLLLDHIPPKEYVRRRILCGEPPHFQGDERDIVFLSMVDTPNPPNVAGAIAPRRLRGDPGDLFKKRYNVAASRARDQLWVVHSLDYERDLQPHDLRRRLLEWATDPGAAAARKANAEAKVESPFEMAVASRLIDAGYDVRLQYPVGPYRLDIVVVDESRRLAVECDGERWHSSLDDVLSDLNRQAQLERMGWTFHRVRGSAFYRNADGEIHALTESLDRMGIRPVLKMGHSHTTSADALLSRVRRRAAELLKAWQTDDFEQFDKSDGPAAGGHDPENPIERPTETSGDWRDDSASPVEEPLNTNGRADAADPDQAEGPSQESPGPSSAQSQAMPTPQIPHETAPEPESNLAEPTTTQPPGQRQMAFEGDTPEVTAEARSLEEVIGEFRRRGIVVEDLRSKGGSLWVYGARTTLSSEMTQLRRRGIRFNYSDKRTGWFTKG
ncbi:hypothetical protein AYO38_10145 [bacterium SCGC AG-212-C10]|nr:hypothetical protein AYO38_10145 [bacterium SCGC AG-212-C10]